ncbi:MAG: squalene--hopene cyclase [Planctomycetaceae bacterium]|nr:squalene--hopene cyclase [Planctomycetaceae bacterium]
MNSGRQDSDQPTVAENVAADGMALHVDAAALTTSIKRTVEYLHSIQHDDGYWVGELEGDTILESEYILLLTFLGKGQSPEALRAAEYIRQQQLPCGGWSIYPGGPLEISASVKAYFALKIAGYDADRDFMQRAREVILAAGGVEKVNSFTRYYLALLGVIPYNKCPAVPPELMLIPTWMPLNIYEMSAWSRTILVPLSLLWAFRPSTELPEPWSIRELFVRSPEQLPMAMGASDVVDEMSKRRWLHWNRVFQCIDAGIKWCERLGIKPFRKKAIARADEWMRERFADSDGLGAIFPPIIWSVVALKCLGHDDDSELVTAALDELKALVISEGEADRLQPCKSPVWDTSIATIAMLEAGVEPTDAGMQRAVDWLLSKEVREHGDWAVRVPDRPAAGWFFEFNNRFYPDVDDTCMVVMALARWLPQDRLSAEFLIEDWSPHAEDGDAAAIVSGRGTSAKTALAEIERLQPVLSAIHRGARWVLDMQSRDGGWGAFDVDNTREIFTQVPFADHNAMIDPSTADLTARMLEMFADVNLSSNHASIQRALKFVWDDQEEDGAWYGRWGVNYLYGTWQALVGLAAIGIPTDDERMQRGVAWLKSKQRANGGWGESPRTYDEPWRRGEGPVTASQTAWALMGLMAAGEVNSPEVRRGVEFLMSAQEEDGTWQEDWFTGTGFPRVFYLKYHLYRIYFPLMALGRYAKLMS